MKTKLQILDQELDNVSGKHYINQSGTIKRQILKAMEKYHRQFKKKKTK